MPILEPFLKRLWEDKEVPFQLDSGDKQVVVIYLVCMIGAIFEAVLLMLFLIL